MKLTYTGDPDGLTMLLSALRRDGLDPHLLPVEDDDSGAATVVWVAGSADTDDPAARAAWATGKEAVAKVRARVPNVRIEVVDDLD